ncbi:Mbov_0399 family ICE element protein [Spiroplasma platyhelix]|uniref:Adhesin P123 n=1 Tax=Spiroplasma platyhelix PALS-1 TaxID=1276218 RepID=A0A846U5R9_9MOLU|nr:hypothetical protein [Spiroplasma platyhelix]MBE4704428.1 hypothetical protein [Spiroplasma platyhelix PALS-1]NKE38797.1 hypothetical protein [Spiroplasma platyhelix PALS-1]UJB29010.1 hypothetical protein SPLAT_v1c02460 [Spiroplasma platyhelix PALS-1]
MKKIWTWMLSSILFSGFVVTTTETFDKLSISNLADSPFHPDIKISNSASATVRQEGNLAKGSTKENYYGTTEIIWTNYASTWEQFKKYYKTISLNANGYADGKQAGKKSFSSVSIAVSSIAQQSSWHANSVLRASGSKYCLTYTNKSFTWGSYNQSGVYYDAIVSGSTIKLRFYLWTEAYQYGTGSIWTESYLNYRGGTISSSWKLSAIKDSLNSALSNQIKLESNYSGSLEDPNNIKDPTGKGNDETTLINGVIAKVLGDEYGAWKQYIQPFSFSNATRQATIVFKFLDPVTKQQQVWSFNTPINITLSHDYWGKSLSERLHIEPGQIVNPEDSTKGMVPDVGLQIEPDKVSETYGGNMQYHTTAHIEFDGLEDSTEWMTVNGQLVEVLNNKFIYDMVDNRVENGDQAVNVYDIIIYHDDGSYKEQYQIKYTISSLVPTLEAKWYAWDPETNPDQKKLITPTLSNGKTNPDYDKEVNPKTGTKTQIIWVKKKSQYPFPLDPLNKQGELINPNANAEDYDLGFIAEGSVAGMGVQQSFKPSQVKSVSREGVDDALKEFTEPNDKQKLTEIIPNKNNTYWSWQGMWHYITKTLDGLAYEKYVLIGPNYQNKYPRFLDVLNDSTIAVDFWTTIHGFHLKNYLAKYKNLDSGNISILNYEQVVSYWKEYTSDIIAQRIPVDPNPANYLDLSEISFWTIKMNLTSVDLIKEEIIKQVQSQLAKTSLIYQEDYQFKSFGDDRIKELLDYDSEGDATIELDISALTTSTRAIGSNTIKVKNNIHYDPDRVFDLSKIKPWFYTQNFSELTIEQLRDNWILASIEKKLISAKAELVYQTDYGVQSIDDETLAQFISSKELVSLSITIYALDSSLKVINGTTLELTNDPEGQIAPTKPPAPDPDPNPLPPNNTWIAKQTNLIIMSVVVVLIVTTIGTIIFFKYRLKKGIGGKKKKNQLKK